MTKIRYTLIAGMFVFMTACQAQASAPPKSLAHAKLGIVPAEPPHPTANLSYKVAGTRYYPRKSVQKNFSQTGRASWYGPGFHGKRTSSGERFDMNALTAAHKTLPIPSYARVTNLANGKSVVVRINDRGPFHGKRVMDLSKGAAVKLGFVRNGSTDVRIEALGKGETIVQSPVAAAVPALASSEKNEAVKPADAKNIYVNLKSFDNAASARAFVRQTANSLSKHNMQQHAIMVKRGNGYTVRVGPFAEQKNADEAHARIKDEII